MSSIVLFHRLNTKRAFIYLFNNPHRELSFLLLLLLLVRLSLQFKATVNGFRLFNLHSLTYIHTAVSQSVGVIHGTGFSFLTVGKGKKGITRSAPYSSFLIKSSSYSFFVLLWHTTRCALSAPYMGYTSLYPCWALRPSNLNLTLPYRMCANNSNFKWLISTRLAPLFNGPRIRRTEGRTMWIASHSSPEPTTTTYGTGGGGGSSLLFFSFSFF